MFARKRKKKWPIVLVLLLLCLLLLAAAGWQICRTLELRLYINGHSNVSQEYGSSYEDSGATAVLTSTRFPELCLYVPVNMTGNIDPNKVGAYAIAYHTRFLWLEDTAVRVVQIVDTQPPVITLTEIEGDYTLPGSEYKEVGFSAYDDYDGDISHLVTWSYKENVITYVVQDSSGNHAIAQRAVNYDDPIAPELTLSGDREITVHLGRNYEDPGYKALDNFDGDITSWVKVEGSVDFHTPGVYTVTYSVTDTFGNISTAQRNITVEPCPEPETVVPEGKVIYLTFDDGPGKDTPRLLEILKKYNVKATFFVVSNKYADTITEIAAQGHAVGVHTASHIYSEIYANEEAFFEDFQTVHDLIYQKTGHKTTIMRFPGGSSNRVSGSYNKGIMTRLSKIVTDYGLQYFDWNVNSVDAGGATTADQVYRNVINGISGNAYSVVLQHDIYSFSVDAVERIIQWGLANGYQFLPLEENSPKCHQKIIN